MLLVEARAKCRDGGFGVAMKLTIQIGRECRFSTRRSLWGSGLASLAEQWSDGFAGRARLERRSSRSDFARNQSSNSVLVAALFDGARRLRRCRVSQFAGKGHCRIRFSIEPLLGVLCGTLFAPLEDVMNSRRGAAVTLGNSGYRLALCIPCRNGAPFALRNFGHVCSCFVCQRPLRIFHGISLSPERHRRIRALQSQTPPDITSAYRKVLKAK
jgi:hypothetical protein